MKTKLALLYGGKSAEHNVSLQTAKAVIEALDFNKFDVYPIYIAKDGKWRKGKQLLKPVETVAKLTFSDENMIAPTALAPAIFQADKEAAAIDVVFPLLHGPNGEDGTVQGLLELLNLPYVGNGVLSSSAGMDKVIMKNIFAQAGLEQVKYTAFTHKEWEKVPEACYEKVEEQIGYPCFVKPANLGSSVGISKSCNRSELEAACKEAFIYDRKIIIEEGVAAREIEIAVLGNDEPECSVAGEIIPKSEFYDYKAKYEDGDTALVIPADLLPEEYNNLQEIAIAAFKSLDCSGLVRADFFLTKEGKFLINEVNTMPGFTPFSMFPLLWKESGLEYPQLIERLIQLAMERYEEKQKIKFTY
ncbi:D-alanine--D-alanine ligase [Bacillaceae bacterium Marseille-Q3522]|nr:D-alanine--D-alanine ligase [Bacillaceae bacterium Marseille-Q3522]